MTEQPEGEGPVPVPEDALVSHVLDAIRGADSPDVVPETSTVSGFAEFLAVEAALDRRWPETVLEPSLKRISELVDLLGDPHRGYPIVHLTGTNGKTSTARMIDALLTEIGLRTGRYTSPHLQLATERINVDPRRSPRSATSRSTATCCRSSSWSTPPRPPTGAGAVQVRGAHRDGVRRVRRRPGRGGDRRGRPGRALGRHQRGRRRGRGGHPDRAGPRRVPRHRRVGHRPGEGRDHQARRGRRAGRPGPGGGRRAAGALRRGGRAGGPGGRGVRRASSGRSRSAGSGSRCAGWAAPSTRSSCRCTASTRPATPRWRWPRRRR